MFKECAFLDHTVLHTQTSFMVTYPSHCSPHAFGNIVLAILAVLVQSPVNVSSSFLQNLNSLLIISVLSDDLDLYPTPFDSTTNFRIQSKKKTLQTCSTNVLHFSPLSHVFVFCKSVHVCVRSSAFSCDLPVGVEDVSK